MTPAPIQYVNENLTAGNWGYFFVVLSFGAAFFAMLAYIMFMRTRESGWKLMARTGFALHGIGVIGIGVMLFFLIFNHRFEYYYVWNHSSRDLPTHYILACFWAGQEGSFLLWTFWHVILGGILIWRAKTFETPVMIVICAVQLMLASMLLGLDKLDIFGSIVNLPIKLGSNPFILLRKAMPNIPFFTDPNYISKIDKLDGNGLNPLLQNYWMVIHPPVLFLGFASTVVPFAYAMAGLWQRRYTEWVKPVLPWALFNGMILGTGILMGGAWAYEALSFGGFWAWDPVENASLVPWLIVIAGLHCLVIYRARKSGLAAAFIFVPVAFFLILYSTFLTRSGILGDSSVHSFTDLGLSGQLLIFMAIFGVMAIVSIVYNWRNIPKTEKEESTYSREFWMFIGSLVLSISCIHIVVFTSIPVINKIMQAFNPHGKLIAPPLDVIGTYHTVQIPLAIIIALMSGFAQHLKYKKSHPLLFWKKVGVSAGLAVILSAIYAFIIDLRDVNLLILLTASVFSIICNLEIIIGFLRNKKYAVSGAAVAHIGIALILIGALVSNGKREILSLNTEGINIFKNASAKDKLENKVMYNGLKVYMGKNMEAVYLADSFAGRYVYYKIRYRKYDNEWKELKEEFTVHPTMIYNKNKDEISGPSPDTRHYLTKDIFTAISFAPNKNAPDYQVTYDTAFVIHLKPKQTIKVDSFTVTLRNIEKFENKLPDGKGMAYRVLLTLEVNDGNLTKTVTPALILTNGTISHEDGEIHDFGLGFSYHTVNPDKDEHEIIISKGKRPTPDFITVKAYIFPYINVLWIGSLVMIIGFLMSIWKRRK